MEIFLESPALLDPLRASLTALRGPEPGVGDLTSQQ